MIIILNQTAGGADGDDALAEMISSTLQEHSITCTIWRSGAPHELQALAARAANALGDVVAAGGGDGTINMVASALLGTEKTLGVLPLGTLNHFARDLGIPLDLRHAVEVLATGARHRVDVGEVNGRIFLNNSSLGLYPRIVRHRQQQQQRLGRGKWPAFAWALLSALHVCPALRLRLHADNRETVVRTPFLFIGNNAYRMNALGIGSRERLDGGVLSVYHARGRGGWGVVALAMRSLVGRLEQARNFEFFETQELEVITRRAMIDVSTDGEVQRLASPLKYRIHPQRLPVLLPNSDKK